MDMRKGRLPWVPVQGGADGLGAACIVRAVDTLAILGTSGFLDRCVTGGSDARTIMGQDEKALCEAIGPEDLFAIRQLPSSAW